MLNFHNKIMQHIQNWPLPAQQRTWIMVVAASSAMDTEETQSLMAGWLATGDLSPQHWARMRQLAEYATSEQYVKDETARRMRLIMQHAKPRRGLLQRLFGR